MDHGNITTPTPLSRLAARLMRIFFRLLYHSLAWAYDLVAATVSVGRWKRWIAAAAGLIGGPRVLELGFGPGHLQEHLHAAGIQVFGLDESRQMARQAARRLARGGFPARLARGLAQSLPYPTGSFDSAAATFPTPYIVDPRTLAEVRRVLRPGGRLVVLMAGWITGRSLPDRLMAYLTRVTGQAPAPDQELQEYTRPYTEAGFQASLRFIEQPGSRLMVILARKAPEHPP
jgi:ubiquinone/menaquinone biosynthesis C-methylase UbiE